MAGEKKTNGNASGKDELVMGVAWFRKEEWPKLLEVSANRDQLEDTYDGWLKVARASLLDLSAEGLRVEKVDVGVEELIEWCRARGVPVDAAARADFASFKLQLRHNMP